MGEKGQGDDESSVRVAIRIRPQNAREKIDVCRVCTQVTPGEPQVFLGKDKAFTYDFVFDMDSTQEMLYNKCPRSLIEGCLEGYNATIFAYGQTGAGKTYTMGTGFDINATPEEIGIIPRAVDHLFQGIEVRRSQALEKGETPPDFKVTAQFMELYNEEIIDLLDTTRDPSERNKKSHIKIHEDAGGGIYTVGVTSRAVTSLQDTMQCLKVGALSRTTASTNMNSQSSRSHAIFTLHIKQQRVVKAEEIEIEDMENVDENMVEEDKSPQLNEFEMLTAKFHFVDLAGSERLKRTGATGERAKEGISINCGLLALGNVISALGDKMKRGCHVPYRDSKLTRLLQDSLGGNSRTVMIACVSPCDRDFMETLNTMKYANRARNIQNKVTVNQDKTSKQIAALRIEIKILQEELLEYKQGKRLVDSDGVESINDMYHENTMLQTENNNLRKRIKAMQETIENLNAKNVQLLSERDLQHITNISGDASQDEITKLIQGYIQEIEELRTKLVESEALCETLRKQPARSPSSRSSSVLSTPLPALGEFCGFDVTASQEDQVEDILELAKKDLDQMKKKCYSRQSSKSHSSNKEELGDNDVDKDINEAEDDENAESQEKSEGEGSDEEMEGYQDVGEEESSEESDAEDQDSDNIHEDLAELTCEISIKQKLIDELEVSQKRLQTLKHQYEEKLNLLQSKIKDTETERDQVLNNMNKIETSSSEQVKKVKAQYQKKLDEMQAEMKKLQAAKKEHSKLLRNQSHYEKQLKTLQHELTEMKKTKVRLMNQVKEEAKRNQISQSRTNKEIAQLKKDQRQREVQIRNLESAKRQKEIILRRKQEEFGELFHQVEQLRRRPIRNMSAKVAGRSARYTYPPPLSNNNPTSTVTATNNNKTTRLPGRVQRRRSNQDFSSKAAKQKWDAVEKSMNGIVKRKQTVSHMETDMNTWLKEREKLVKKVEKLTRKRHDAVNEERDEKFLLDLDFEIENLHARLEEAQDNISECQSNIMELMEIKDDEAMSFINTCNLEEARYLLEHMVGLVISKGLNAAQKTTEVKELNVKLGKIKRHNSFHYSLLQYVMHQSNSEIEIEDEWLSRQQDEVSGSDSDGSASDASDLDRYLENLLPENMSTSNVLESKKKKEKARRKTATTEDLLYANTAPADGMKPLLPLPSLREDDGTGESGARGEKTTPNDKSPDSKEPSMPSKDTLAVPKGTKQGGILGLRESLERFTQELAVPKQPVQDSVLMPPPKGLPLTKANSSHGTETTNSRPEPSPAMRRKAYNRPTPEPSPQMRRRNFGNMSRQSSLDRGSDAEGPTPPGSPTSTRKSSLTMESSDVFSRLTGSRSSSPSNNSGTITPNTKIQTNKSCPLVCTHKAEGHTKAVLSVCATDELMFSSSKDRSAKVWDLNTGQEIATLTGHPNNVTCVKYCEATKLVFTVSTYFTKLWDIRDHNKCVKTLCSSGQCTTGPPTAVSSSSRQVGLPLGEMMINDIVHNRQGTMLFSAAGNQVRLWDLRRYLPVGKLSGGHQAAIMTLTMQEDDEVTVVTGSKDHYIKVFQMPQSAIGVLTPKYNLEPPHYDGIQCLAMTNNILFSGSRDNCIKKWDLAEQQLKQSLNSAHKDWVCGLAFMPGGNCLLSCCRGGYLKLWHVDSCMQIGEIKAHTSPVNAITTNSSSVFTASNDLTVGIWRARSLDNSDSCQSD